MSLDTARNYSSAIPLYLPDVVVDARDCDSTLDRAFLESAAAGAGRVHAGGTVFAGRANASGKGLGAFQLAQLLPCVRPFSESLGAGWPTLYQAVCAGQMQRVDDPAF